MIATRAVIPLHAVFAAWVLSLGCDALLHAGILASLYRESTPFLLAPESAFARIPAGYAAFFLLTLTLAWLLERLEVGSAREGLRTGLLAGLVVWGALCLGLWSITTASPALLLGWWLGQALELGLAGAVLGTAAVGAPVRCLWCKAVGGALGCIALAVLLQLTGLAPPMRAV